MARLRGAVEERTPSGSEPARSAPGATVDRLLDAAVAVAREHPALPALLAEADRVGPGILLRAIGRSLPGPGATREDDVTRDLAARVFCAGLGLAVRQADPVVLLPRTRQAVLGALTPPADPAPPARPSPECRDAPAAPAAPAAMGA
ncbi:hypothetical protein ACIQJ4_10400 [Streptomyces filamentosus]|uniref:hypothetical protein n=1 Tax=Streptomyces filamentosus TaxID=67294 RepID=UPI00381010EA